MNDQPAFPVMWGDGTPERGMTLRQWYAGQALIGLISLGEWGDAYDLAKDAYRIADAMLAERAKQEGKE